MLGILGKYVLKMVAGDIEFEQQLVLLRQKYAATLEPLLDRVDAMLKEAASQEYALRAEIARLKGLPLPPATPWTRCSVFDARQYLQSVDYELGSLNRKA